MTGQKPRPPFVSAAVHYVSYGTPNGEYTPQCRAAIVTAVPEPGTEDDPDAVFASLCVLNPTGQFFNEYVIHSDHHVGGTWHWPERVG